MKRIGLVLVIIIGSCLSTFSQSDTTGPNKVYTVVQIRPVFPGGPDAWARYLERNLNKDLALQYLKLPEGAGITIQTVVVSFLVDESGVISDVRADNEDEVHPKLAKEAVRVVRKGPKWIPAEQDGKKVAYRQRQNITFFIQG